MLEIKKKNIAMSHGSRREKARQSPRVHLGAVVSLHAALREVFINLRGRAVYGWCGFMAGAQQAVGVGRRSYGGCR